MGEGSQKLTRVWEWQVSPDILLGISLGMWWGSNIRTGSDTMLFCNGGDNVLGFISLFNLLTVLTGEPVSGQCTTND